MSDKRIASNKQNDIRKYIERKIKEVIPDEEETQKKKKYEISADENSAMILVISDVHLGAIWKNRKLFRKFLNKLCKYIKVNKNLKALIINGDFFDLCANSYRDLSACKIYHNIYKKLYKLQAKNYFKVIFTLGNHEIPITGNFDRKFKYRKNDFIKKFNKKFSSNGVKTFLYNNKKRNNVCQYILLNLSKTIEHNHEWELQLFDSRDQISDRQSPYNPIYFNNHFVPETVDDNYNCLITHGYQFDTGIYREVGPHAWLVTLKCPDVLKEFFTDVIWNSILSSGINKKIAALDIEEVKNFFDKKITELLTEDQEFRTLFEEFLKKNLIQDDSLSDNEKKKIKKIIDKIFDKMTVFDLINYYMGEKKKWKVRLIKFFKWKIINFIYYMKESEELRATRQNDMNYREILNMVAKDEFRDINKVIFGHTHNPDKTKKTGKYIAYTETKRKEHEKSIFIHHDLDIKVSITNSGGWQKVIHPNITVINLNGEISNHIIKDAKDLKKFFKKII